ERLGFDVRRVPVLENVSSSRIRELLHAGEPDRAARLLGRPAEVEGIVVHGDGRGRELGFPTANLDVPPGLLVPLDGVYAGWARGWAIASCGASPSSMTPSAAVRSAVRRRPPPAEPIASTGAPPSRTSVGAIMLCTRSPDGGIPPTTRSASPSMLLRWRSR